MRENQPTLTANTPETDCRCAGCGDSAREKIRGHAYCGDHAKKFRPTAMTRTPDVVPPRGPAGQARERELVGAVLSVAPYRLPDGRNY